MYRAFCQVAGELARLVSGDLLYNHLIRCYLLGELYARIQGWKIDREQLFVSALFHDPALTDFVRGPHRFEIESAHAAREFLLQKGATKELAQKVWHNVALHTLDMNMFRSETRDAVQFGITFDMFGFPDLNSHRSYPHAFHRCSRIAHNRGQLVIADLSTL
jgi:hypothetical protein